MKGDPNAYRMPQQGPMSQPFMQRAAQIPPQGPMANRGANPAFANRIAQMTGPSQLQAMQRVRGAQGPMAAQQPSPYGGPMYAARQPNWAQMVAQQRAAGSGGMFNPNGPAVNPQGGMARRLQNFQRMQPAAAPQMQNRIALADALDRRRF